MTDPAPSLPEPTVHDLVIQLFGSFSRVQLMIDSTAKLFFQKHIPETAEFIYRQVVDRIRDSDRPKLLQLIAKDVDSDADLQDFNSVYAGVKRLRDRAAHADGATVDDSGSLHFTTNGHFRGPDAPDPETLSITADDLKRALHECHWLYVQALYITGSLAKALHFGENLDKVRVIRPTRLPKDWDGRLIEIADSSGS